MLLAQEERGIATSVDEMAHRIRFDHAQEFPFLAKPARDRAVIHVFREMAQMTFVQPEPAFVWFSWCDKTTAREMRNRNTRDGRPSRMQAFIPCAFIEEFLARGGRAARESLRHDELLSGQPMEPARLQRAREMRADAGWMKTKIMEVAFGRIANTRNNLHSQYIRGQQIAAGTANCSATLSAQTNALAVGCTIARM